MNEPTKSDEEAGDAAVEIFHVFYPHSPKNSFHPKTRVRIREIIDKEIAARVQDIWELAAKAQAMRDVPNEHERKLYEAIEGAQNAAK